MYKFLIYQLFVFFLLNACNNNIDQEFNGGDGSEANPYQISTIEQLQAIGEVENLDKHFIQVKDIDVSSSIDPDSYEGFISIGTRETPFTGSYDGNRNQIIDLIYNEFEQFIGLFGYIKNAEINDVTLVNTLPIPEKDSEVQFKIFKHESLVNRLSIDPDSDNFKVGGALVAFNDAGVIKNCQSFILFASRRHATGGLVGYNGGEIYNSTVTKVVSGNDVSGGLVGYNSGLIKDSLASGGARSIGMAGGLVGYNYGGQIINSYSKGDVNSQNTNGGLAAINTGLIHSSYADVETAASNFGFTGGLVGENEGEIRESYSLGTVSYQETSGAGSLVGINRVNGIVEHTYATGLVMIADDIFIGGLIGENNGQTVDSYWDTESTGQDEGVGTGSAEGATGLATAQMSGPEAEANMPGFDWETVWRTTEDGYPVLRWEEE